MSVTSGNQKAPKLPRSSPCATPRGLRNCSQRGRSSFVGGVLEGQPTLHARDAEQRTSGVMTGICDPASRCLARLVWALGCCACGSDGGAAFGAVVDPAASTGSCYFGERETCDEHAEPIVDPGNVGRCVSSGGQWASHQCVLEGRSAACLDTSTATRSYAFSSEAAARLQATCSTDKFVVLAGSCNYVARQQCEEHEGFGASGRTPALCVGGGGEWTTGGTCPADGRIASCAEGQRGTSPITRTYAYSVEAAERLEPCAGPFIRDVDDDGGTGA